MTNDRLSALFVSAVLLHNLEEAIWLPAWSPSAGRWHQPVAPLPFAFAAVVLSLLLIGLAIASRRQGAQHLSTYLFAGYVFAMVANVVFPHLAASILTKSYMPGTLTAVLFNAPLGVWLLRSLQLSGHVTLRRMYWVGPLVALCLLASIPVLFWVGVRLLA